jgi:ABC-type uncharacterized transport system auxiliary subunit
MREGLFCGPDNLRAVLPWRNGLTIRLVGLAAVTFGLLGCPAPRPIKYYEVNYVNPGTPVAPDAIDATLMVHLFETSRLYLDDKIVYGFEGPEMGTYESSRWAEPPVAIMQSALVRGLRATGRFKAVYTLRSDANGRFILAGHLYDFKEVDTNPMVARLDFDVRLRDRSTGLTVWNHTYSHDEPAADKTINALVVAMDKNVQRSVQEVDAGLEAYFRANPVK